VLTSLAAERAYGKPFHGYSSKTQYIQGRGTRNTRLRTPNVKHEARCVVRASEHGRTDAGKSNPRASASRRAARLECIQHLEACGVDLYLDQQAIDTTTPMGKLVFQLTGAFAEFERTMIRQRIKAGLKRAIAQGVKLGRPKIDSATERKVRNQLAKGVGILKVARSLGIGTGTVQRIAKELR